MHNRFRNLLAAIVALLLLACVAERAVPPTESAVWSVDADPLIAVGGTTSADGLHQFGDVAGAARLTDGGVVVADGKQATLEFFSSEGEYVRTVGGKGEGPSEFSRLVAMLRCGDSLYVRDIALNKYKVFSTDGMLGRIFALPNNEGGMGAVQTACNSDAVFIHYGFETTRELPSRSQIVRQQVPYWIANSAGVLQTALGKRAGLERWFTKTPNGGGLTRLPLGKGSVIAIGKSKAYIGTADSFAIEVVALDGSPAGAIRKRTGAQKTTAADIERFKYLDTVGLSPTQTAAKVKRWTTTEFATTLPAYTALIVDSSDNLWVRMQPPATGETVTWIVFSQSGQELAHIALPQLFQVFEVGNDYVLGAQLDLETGVKTVSVLRLRQRSAEDR